MAGSFCEKHNAAEAEYDRWRRWPFPWSALSNAGTLKVATRRAEVHQAGAASLNVSVQSAAR
jgi:hypothetical protein